mgnify:FL=1
MRPCISFDDVNITPVDKTTQRWDQKKKKYIDLKKPVVKKGKTLNIGDCYDLFELVRKLDHHIDLINGHDDYIDVNFKLRAMY